MLSSIAFRYWALPSWWRRRSRAARSVVGAGLLALSLGAGAYPLLVWRPARAWNGFDALLIPVVYVAFMLLADFAIALGGANTIARERDRQTWEALLMTPLGLPRLVLAMALCRAARYAAVLALFLPFWLAWGFEALQVNRTYVGGPFANGDTPLTAGREAARVMLYLGWLGLRTIAHALPMVALGVAFSARCSRARTAMACAGAAVVGYVALLWGLGGVLSDLLPDGWSGPIGSVLAWPFLPVEYERYEGPALLPEGWKRDLLADSVWVLLVPLALYRLAVRGCRRRDYPPAGSGSRRGRSSTAATTSSGRRRSISSAT